MSDGGDGFGEIIGKLLHAKPQTIKTVDASRRTCQSIWWWESRSKTAIIESANVIGLALLPPGKFHPFDLDTFGLGALVQGAAKTGARRCLIGIGGSATNDGGFGLARALGWKFFDQAGHSIERWTEIHRLHRIQKPRQPLRFDELIVAVDVRNVLLGTRGATRVFGPQKGLKPAELANAESNLRRLAQVCGIRRSQSAATVPGSGAAGGLGFGLVAFAGARLESGFEMFARLANLDEHLRAADLVITGEGCLDESTSMGKGAGAIAQRCRKFKRPCIALVGTTSLHDSVGKNADFSRRLRAREARLPAEAGVPQLFTAIHSLTRLTSATGALKRSGFWLERLAQKAAQAQTRAAKA